MFTSLSAVVFFFLFLLLSVYFLCAACYNPEKLVGDRVEQTVSFLLTLCFWVLSIVLAFGIGSDYSASHYSGTPTQHSTPSPPPKPSTLPSD